MSTQFNARQPINLSTKKAIIEAYSTITSTTELGRKFNLSPSTINTIIKNKEKILDEVNNGFKLDSARLNKGKNVKLEEELMKWIKSCNLTINGPKLKEKAAELVNSLNIENFKASTGWLDNFKKRHSIRFKSNKTKSDIVPLGRDEDLLALSPQKKMEELIQMSKMKNIDNLVVTLHRLEYNTNNIFQGKYQEWEILCSKIHKEFSKYLKCKFEDRRNLLVSTPPNQMNRCLEYANILNYYEALSEKFCAIPINISKVFISLIVEKDYRVDGIDDLSQPLNDLKLEQISLDYMRMLFTNISQDHDNYKNSNQLGESSKTMLVFNSKLNPATKRDEKILKGYFSLFLIDSILLPDFVKQSISIPVTHNS